MGFVLIVTDYLLLKKKGNYAICTSPQCFRLIKSGVKIKQGVSPVLLVNESPYISSNKQSVYAYKFTE